MVLFGNVLIFSKVLDASVKPIIQDLENDLADDIAAVKAGVFTEAHFMVVSTLVVFVVLLFLFVRYDKFAVMWWGQLPSSHPWFVNRWNTDWNSHLY